MSIATSAAARAVKKAGRRLFDFFFYWEEVEAPRPAKKERAPAQPPPVDEPPEAVRAVVRQCGLTRPESAAALHAAVRAFTRWVGDIPASAVDHHARPGGLLDHSLEALERAAPRIARLRLKGESPERAAVLEDPHRLAAAIAVLFHDVGKVMRIRVRFNDDDEVWEPLAEPVETFRARRPDAPIGTWWIPRRGKGLGRHEQYNSPLLARIVPETVWEAVQPFRDELLTAVGLEPSDSPVVLEIRKILGRADRESAAAEAQAPRAEPARPAVPESIEDADLERAEAASPRPTLTLAKGITIPAYRGIIHRRDLGPMVERFGANTVPSPVLVGAYTCAIECPSPIYDAVVAPQLDALRAGGLIHTCAKHPGCPEVRFDVTVASSPPDAGGEERRASFVFVSLLAFGGPIMPDDFLRQALAARINGERPRSPTAPPAFGGRIAFVGEHTAKPQDFRFCVKTSSFEMIYAVAEAIGEGKLKESIHWVRVPDPEGRPLVAIIFNSGLKPFVPETAPPDGEPSIDEQKRQQGELAKVWDRFLRLRPHMLPQPPNLAHQVYVNGRTRYLMPLIPAFSASILAKLDGK